MRKRAWCRDAGRGTILGSSSDRQRRDEVTDQHRRRLATYATGEGLCRIALETDRTWRQPMSATAGLFAWGMSLRVCAFHDSYAVGVPSQFGPYVAWARKPS
jgi:hypothetical protein